MTRQRLADLTGIPVRSLAGYEAGIALPLGRAVQIARALGITVDDLVDLEREEATT